MPFEEVESPELEVSKDALKPSHALRLASFLVMLVVRFHQTLHTCSAPSVARAIPADPFSITYKIGSFSDTARAPEDLHPLNVLTSAAMKLGIRCRELVRLIQP